MGLLGEAAYGGCFDLTLNDSIVVGQIVRKHSPMDLMLQCCHDAVLVAAFTYCILICMPQIT